MAQAIQEEEKVFPREPCDKSLILSSLKKHQPDGAIMGVEKLIQPKKNTFGKVTIPSVLTIVGTMPKCILYDLDADGQYIMEEDEITGETKKKLRIGDGNLQTVFFPFYANIGKGEEGLDEETTLVITPGTSSYSFFKECLIDGGELPEDTGDVAIATNYKELKECCEGFTFRGKYELIKGKNRSFPSLLVERVSDEEL